MKLPEKCRIQNPRDKIISDHFLFSTANTANYSRVLALHSDKQKLSLRSYHQKPTGALPTAVPHRQPWQAGQAMETSRFNFLTGSFTHLFPLIFSFFSCKIKVLDWNYSVVPPDLFITLCFSVFHLQMNSKTHMAA